MSDESPFQSVSMTNQFVLLGLAELTREDETPVQAHELRQHCKQHGSDVDTEVVGTLTEADVIRSLYRLEDEGFVHEADSVETSPTGKGRQAYTLAVSADDVYDGVADELVDDSSD
jgi:hypothetical protein